MPDWVYELGEAFVAFMSGRSLLDNLALLVAGTVMLPPVVLVHELGHALAALALRHRVVELAVGDDQPLLTVAAGGFRLRLGVVTGRGDAAGYILYDAARCGPRDVLMIALAGPLASLAGALATGAATAALWSHTFVATLLVFATVAGLVAAVDNLIPRGADARSFSDGRWIQLAVRALREPPRAGARHNTPDPNAATSVAPPAR